MIRRSYSSRKTADEVADACQAGGKYREHFRFDFVDWGRVDGAKMTMGQCRETIRIK